MNHDRIIIIQTEFNAAVDRLMKMHIENNEAVTREEISKEFYNFLDRKVDEMIDDAEWYAVQSVSDYDPDKLGGDAETIEAARRLAQERYEATGKRQGIYKSNYDYFFVWFYDPEEPGLIEAIGEEAQK